MVFTVRVRLEDVRLGISSVPGIPAFEKVQSSKLVTSEILLSCHFLHHFLVIKKMNPCSMFVNFTNTTENVQECLKLH